MFYLDRFLRCSKRARAWLKCSVLPLLLCLVAGCETVPTGPTVETSISDAERKERSDRIRDYFQERLKARGIVATTVTRSGQTIDWIRIESQVEGGRIAAAPTPEVRTSSPYQPRNAYLNFDAALRRTELSARTELQLDDRALGPPDTVPIVRFDVERYLATVRIPPRDPRDVLRKIEPPAPDSNKRYYAVWQRFDTFYGTSGRINVWDTSGPVNDETSIAQTAVIRGDPMQAIEAGKIEYQSLNSDQLPHLFTYFRTSGSASGDWVGGYNTLVKGWVQYSRTVAPGMSLAAWDSTTRGNQYSLDVEVRLYQGNWWVWAAGEWAGYYPFCVGGGVAPCTKGTLFSDNGIRDQASRLDWYGEIFDSSAPSPTSTDMGSGEFASSGWQHAAYFRNLTFYWQPATYWWWDSGSVSVTDAGCYDADGPYYSSDAAWHNWFFYGGPGKEGKDCH